jgi:hypothetical protein
MFFDVSLARNYNLLTGGALTHLDIKRMSVFEKDEIRELIEHSDILI